jgi:hypothetical protein
MTEYFAFYSNMIGKREVVPVAFPSQKKADDFISKYQYSGGFKQFNYDHHGKDKKRFVEWLDRNYLSPAYGLSRGHSIVKYKDGDTLFKYMMSMFV